MGLADELQKLDELRRRGALSEAEFAQAKAALLAGGAAEEPLHEHLAEQLDEVHRQNELAQIDREWQLEREQYLVANNYGVRQVPTAGMGLAAALVGGIFGGLWTVFAFILTGAGAAAGAPEGFSALQVIFPLFGVVFTVAAVGYGVYTYSRAQRYQQAFAAYQERRRRAAGEGR